MLNFIKIFYINYRNIRRKSLSWDICIGICTYTRILSCIIHILTLIILVKILILFQFPDGKPIEK
jgi:hypothetical protein